VNLFKDLFHKIGLCEPGRLLFWVYRSICLKGDIPNRIQYGRSVLQTSPGPIGDIYPGIWMVFVLIKI